MLEVLNARLQTLREPTARRITIANVAQRVVVTERRASKPVVITNTEQRAARRMARLAQYQPIFSETTPESDAEATEQDIAAQ